MFSLTVCDHIMIAHSFQGEEFGPAQRMHGATFAVEAEFRAPVLDDHQLLVDIGLAKTELRRVLETVDYSNLDENPLFLGLNTTTEYMAFPYSPAALLGLLVLEGAAGSRWSRRDVIEDLAPRGTDGMGRVRGAAYDRETVMSAVTVETKGAISGSSGSTGRNG